MDLMLSNFITDEPPKAEKKKSAFGGTPEGGGKFSMVFNKSQPVKAIVARKRVVVPAAKKKVEVEGLKVAAPAKPVKKVEPAKEFKLSDEFKNGKRSKKPNLFDKMKKDIPKVELPEVVPFTERVFSETRLDSLEIHPHSRKNVADLLGFSKLTVVQDLAIPKVMAGRDVLIRAQTGSGKTLAYALPLVEKLHSAEGKVSRGDGILAVVIVPTRELALQTYELFLKLLKPFTWIVSGYLCGGEKRKAEKARLRAGLNILIGTPGRFCDHIKNTESMKLSGVKYLILDEADRLLELGYEKDVKAIVESIKGDAPLQTVLLSATLTRSVKELAGLTLNNPEYVDTSDVAVERRFDTIEDLEERITIPATVRQSFLVIPPKLRLVSLSGLIAYELNRNTKKALVFMATQDLIDFHYDIMVEVLTRKKLDSDHESSDSDAEPDSDPEPDQPGAILLPKVTFFKLHGKMSQIERSSVFKEFRAARTAVLLCTDVAARGIDVPSVDLVVQYHAPQILADYVHRVGRTARAGQSGKAVLFLEPSEVDFVKHLGEKQIKLSEEKPDPLFGRIGVLLNPGGQRNKNREQAAVELQQRFERLVAAEKELHDGAAKAFVSWVRYYSNFPKELRRMFAIRAVNMGHYAKCLGLRDPPKQFVRQHTGPRNEDGEGEGEQGKKGQKWSQKNGRGAGGGGPRKGKNFTKGGNNSGPMNSRKRSFPAGTGGGGGHQHKDLAGYAKTSRMINTSEFDSGLSPAVARKKPRKH